MKVTLTPRLNKNHPGIVYADVHCAGELLVSATLDYCLDVSDERGYTIENAQEVLMWLQRNSNFVGYRA